MGLARVLFQDANIAIRLGVLTREKIPCGSVNRVLYTQERCFSPRQLRIVESHRCLVIVHAMPHSGQRPEHAEEMESSSCILCNDRRDAEEIFSLAREFCPQAEIIDETIEK